MDPETGVWIPCGQSTEPNMDVTGLTPGQEYKFRVVAGTVLLLTLVSQIQDFEFIDSTYSYSSRNTISFSNLNRPKMFIRMYSNRL